MSNDIIAKVFSEIGEITTLNITGGETFLVEETFKYILDAIKKNKTKVDSFTITINASIYNENILNYIKELRSLCESKINYCILAVSTDKYHLDEIKRLCIAKSFSDNIEVYSDFCFQNKIRFSKNNIADKCIANEGRAKSLDIPKIDIDYSSMAKYWHNDTNLYVGEIVVDTSGYIFGNSDCSYKTIENRNIGNINNEPIKVMLNNLYNKNLKVLKKALGL
jgi:hypothetical protein